MQVKKIISKHSFWFLLLALSALSVSASESFAAQLQLSWTDNSTNETGFRIDRKTGTSGTFAQIASVGSGITSYTDSTVTAGTNYCYRLYAFNTAGNSPYTPEVCGSVPAPVQTFTLAVIKAGTGSGAMTSSPAGINCTTNCSGTFNSGTAVTLTAAPAAGSVFATWAGTGCAATTPAVTVTLGANSNCTGTFNLQTFTLAVAKAGTGSGAMTSSPAGINCTTNCSGTFNSGTAVTLTAAPATGSVFAAWAGTGCAATTPAVTVTLGANRNCTATFNLQTFTLAVASAGAGSGAMTSSPAGINCGSTCSGSYTSGATVVLTAAPATNSTFVSWTGTGCSASTATINVSMSMSRSCTATYNSQPKNNPLTAKIGVFRPSTGQWFLDFNGNGFFDGCVDDTCVTNYGSNAMLPVTGDWDGTGHTSIGVFEPNTGVWHLDNGNGTWDDCGSAGDSCVTTNNNPGSLPVVKEMSSEKLVLGTFQPEVTTQVDGQNVTKQGVWNFDLDGDGQLDKCSIDQCGNFGVLGDLPIVGNWNGTGEEAIGVFRPQSGLWYLDLNGNGKWDGSPTDARLGPFGMLGDIPVAGDWDGTGKIRIGVYRPSNSRWYLDISGDGKWQGCNVDACLGPFGQKGDLPVAGKW